MEKTTPDHHLTSWGGRTIRGRGHLQPPTSWQGETIAIPGQVARLPRKRQHVGCYRLSTRPNCFRGTCSGLGTWRPRCTRGALSGTRHVVPTPFLSLIALVTVLMSGGASPMGPASYTTRASVRAPVPFPQLSLHVLSYLPIIPSPCALGQQVIVLVPRLIVSLRLVYFYPDHS